MIKKIAVLHLGDESGKCAFEVEGKMHDITCLSPEDVKEALRIWSVTHVFYDEEGAGLFGDFQRGESTVAEFFEWLKSVE